MKQVTPTMSYELAFEVYRRDVEEAIAQRFSIPDFIFAICGEEHGGWLALAEDDLKHRSLQEALDLDEDDLDLVDEEKLEDLAHNLLQLVTEKRIKRVVLLDEDRKVLCLG